MSNHDTQQWQERLKAALETIRQRASAAMDSPTAKDFGRRMDQLAEDIERAVNSPRSREALSRVETQLKKLDVEIGRALNTPRAKEIQNDISKTFSDIGKEIGNALDSDTSKEAQAKIGQFLQDVGERLSSRGGKKA